MNTIESPEKNPPTVWTNGRIALGRDLVFGLVVLACAEGEERAHWQPLAQMAQRDLRVVVARMDHDPLFPAEVYEELAQLVQPQPVSDAEWAKMIRATTIEARMVEEEFQPWHQAGGDPNATILVQ